MHLDSGNNHNRSYKSVVDVLLCMSTADSVIRRQSIYISNQRVL